MIDSGDAGIRTPVLKSKPKWTTRLFDFSKPTKYRIPILPSLSETVEDSLVLM